MSGQFMGSCRTVEDANRNQMSGQFIGSCRTVEKVAPSKGVPNFVKRRAIKRRVQFIKRRAGVIMARHVSALVGVPVCRRQKARDARGCLSYKTEAEAEAEKTEAEAEAEKSGERYSEREC
ncbi:hypothetical protein TEA_017576 [Camellia sinensis var. sinensis]|uniref:Uncharacterized protein n=1 Tax=Camellia sinensis var. sinensis TaxID=542762 RepID=A0A4S4DBR6_CAMSN|nr:hypothetical protein TEA_017576 [Camellia sinensis var. sinensis]